jgi:hypothetical protein
MPILGIMASAISGHLKPPGVLAYESIATANGTGSSGVITFNSIPSTFTHLQVRFYVLPSGVNQYSTLRFNGDTTTTNYRYHYLFGSGGGSYGAGQAQNAFSGNYESTTSAGVGILDILDYKNTNKYKTTREINGWDGNTTGTVYTISNVWMNSAAITSITFTLASGNFATATKFALYGIK